MRNRHAPATRRRWPRVSAGMAAARRRGQRGRAGLRRRRHEVVPDARRDRPAHDLGEAVDVVHRRLGARVPDQRTWRAAARSRRTRRRRSSPAVPVLPATGPPRSAARPVPERTTASLSAEVTSAAIGAGSARDAPRRGRCDGGAVGPPDFGDAGVSHVLGGGLTEQPLHDLLRCALRIRPYGRGRARKALAPPVSGNARLASSLARSWSRKSWSLKPELTCSSFPEPCLPLSGITRMMALDTGSALCHNRGLRFQKR